MLYALKNGERIEPAKGEVATCPDCNTLMVAKCGSIMIHHWAHKSLRDCDVWSEGETDWHRSWKALFPKEQVEVKLVKDGHWHRADVQLNVPVNGIRTLEFQHSSISVDDLADREAFYGKTSLLWVFDCIKSYTDKRFWFERSDSKIKEFTWKRGRKSVAECQARVVLDFGQLDPEKPHWLFAVSEFWLEPNEGEWQGYQYSSMTLKGRGRFRTKEQFITAFCTTNPEKA